MTRTQSALVIALAGASGGIACGRVALDLQPPADPPPPPPPPPSPCDQDGDGFLARDCGGDDCNDSDAAVHPGAPDLNAVPGAWMSSRVLTRPGGTWGGTAIAVDRSGGVHIVYAGGPTIGLLYARRAGLDWQVEAIASSVELLPPTTLGPRDRRLALALDVQGAVHLVYSSPGGVRHAVRAGAGWTIETVDPAGHGSAAIAIEPGGAVHAAYAADDGLRHATSHGGAWTIDRVDPLGLLPSLAVDATGTLHIAYGNGVAGAEVLRYATGTAGAWRLETASETRAGSGSVAVGRDGLPRIAFASRYAVDHNVHVLARVGGAWSASRIPTSETVYAETLRLDGRDRPYILFNYLVDDFFATPADDGWRSERINIGNYDVDPSFDLDGAATAHVASTGFYYPDNGTVDYSSNRQLAPDGVDQNCDGVDGVDADGDGHASLSTGGDDDDD